jgi:uncharacterized protein YjbI with pentapeptide repeats
MDKNYTANQTFEGKKYTESRLPKGEYDHCIFEECDFSDSFLDNTHFIECRFIDCNLSNANIKHSLFREVSFVRCKMLGLRFEDCNDFLLSLQFQECSLDFSSFYNTPLQGTSFNSCRLVQTDFTGTDLREASFTNCNMEGGRFDASNLQGADFRSAFNYSIDPERNQMKKARFSREGLEGLLGTYDIIVE